MQIDFHYCIIKILSQKAGFSPIDSQIIAYASQFVDDAIDHKPIVLPTIIDYFPQRINKNILDPICTAHQGLQVLNDFKKDVQSKIYISFHFLPSEIYSNQPDYSYVTQANSSFAKTLISKNIDNFNSNTKSYLDKLISLGISLHTYADTWSHQGFSGIKNSNDNDVKKTKIFKKNKMKKIKILDNFRNNLLPEIGHAEAFNLPDLPYLNWSYINKNEKVFRSNLNIFIDAVENIYKFLSEISNNKSENINIFIDRIIFCLSNIEESSKKRIETYKKYFPEISFYYDPYEWKNEIFETKNHLCFPINYKIEKYKWIIFQEAAMEQREFVCKNIKPL